MCFSVLFVRCQLFCHEIISESLILCPFLSVALDLRSADFQSAYSSDVQTTNNGHPSLPADRYGYGLGNAIVDSVCFVSCFAQICGCRTPALAN